MKVIKIGAVWCPGCIIMKPRWKKIEEEYSWFETEYYDFDTDKEVIEKFGIGEILPVFIFLDRKGEEILRLQGEVDEKEIVQYINKYKDK